MGKLIGSLLLIAAMVAAYRFAAASIRRIQWSSAEVRLRWMVMARNLALLVCLLGLTLVWAEQLRTLALSVVGFAVAIVLVTKELAMCITGGMLRSSASMFGIGDRIEVRKLRGEVIDLNMLTTTILEIGPEHLTHQYSGRAVVLPNSIFLAEPVVNESYTEDYVLHSTLVPLSRDDDWQRSERLLLQAAQTVCADFIDSAKRHIVRVGRREGIAVPPVEPTVSLHLPKSDEIGLIVRYPAPMRKMGATEQAVLRRYLELERDAARVTAEAGG